MIDLANTTPDLTAFTDQVVIEASTATTATLNALEPHVFGDTNIVFTARYAPVTAATNTWTITTLGGATDGLTFFDTMNSGTVTITTSTTHFLPTTAATYNFTWGPTGSVATWTLDGTSRPLVAKEIGGFTIWVPRELTDEEKAEEAVRQAEYRRHMEEERLARKLADEKAEVLLRRFLNPKQRAELDEFGYFHVWARDGFKYRITRNYGHNVARVDPETDKLLKRFCVVPKVSIPSPDRLLAHKLLLESDVERFIKIANVADA